MVKKINRQTSSYWEQRRAKEEEWIKENLSNDEAFNRQLQIYYDRAINNIDEMIKANTDLITDKATGKVTEADVRSYETKAKSIVLEAQKRLKAGQKVQYGDYDKQLNNHLKMYNATMRINRLEWIKSNIGLEMVQLGLNVDADLRDKLSADFQKEIKRQSGIMGESVGKLSSSSMTARIILAQTKGATFSQRLWVDQDVLKSKLDQVIANGIIQGQSNQQVARNLRDQLKSTVDNQRYVTERLARTESSRVQAQAEILSMKGNDFKYCIWIDEPRACTECKQIANKDNGWGKGVYLVDEVPFLPAHPNCRCVLSAYWVDEEEKEAVSGESGAINRQSEHIKNFAPLYAKETTAKALYLEFAQRNRNDSVNKIASAADMSTDDASEVYAHVFEDQHLTLDEDGQEIQAYFDPNYEMAQSFNRIFSNKDVNDDDIIMLKHELYERKLMKANPKMTYQEAHALALKKYPYKGR